MVDISINTCSVNPLSDQPGFTRNPMDQHGHERPPINGAGHYNAVSHGNRHGVHHGPLLRIVLEP